MAPHHIDRRPELSQHFFRDPDFVRRMVAALPIRTRTVLEIGPGRGVITEALSARGPSTRGAGFQPARDAADYIPQRAFRVIAVEKDVRLYRALRSRFIGRTNVELHHDDILRFPLPREPYSVVGNLPFGITSAVMRRLLAATPPPEDAFLVVQREAAEKFAGTPRETMFSLLHKPSFEFEIVRTFRRADFDPPPRVHTALLHIRRRERPLLDLVAYAGYRRFVQAVFGRDASVARTMRPWLTHRQLRRLATDLGFSMTARPSALSFPQWLALYRFYMQVCMGRDPEGTREWATAGRGIRCAQTGSGFPAYRSDPRTRHH